MILVTGSSGFVGNALIKEARQRNIQTRCAFRQKDSTMAQLFEKDQAFYVGEINRLTDWKAALNNIKVVIHCAARTSTGAEADTQNTKAIYTDVNVHGTLNLARQASFAGVKRFIFLSSVKVCGDTSPKGEPFKESCRFNTHEAYASSKIEAEIGLQDIALKTGMEVVCIRPPLVYGPYVKGNFYRMLGWIQKGIPLPLGAIHNKRSLIGIDNLVDFIITCIAHPAAANHTFMASDGEDLSTTELLQRLGIALRKPARLIPLPVQFLAVGSHILGKKNIADRLVGNLQVDISKAKKLLDWTERSVR